MKKIVSIVGSCNERSFTFFLVKDIMGKIVEQKPDFESEIIFLKDYKINYCIGCENCFNTGTCMLDYTDDMKKIRKSLIAADIIVLASPVYFVNVPGKMKCVFDRLSKDIHILRYAGRYGFTISTTVSSGVRDVSAYLERVQLSLGITNLCNYRFERVSDEKEKFCKDVAEDIINRLNEQGTFSKFYLEKLLMMWKKIYNHSTRDTAETRFWKQEWVIESNSFQRFAIQNRRLDKKPSHIDNGFNANKLFIDGHENVALCSSRYVPLISEYIKNVFHLFSIGEIDPFLHAHFLLLLCECSPILKEKEYWKDIGYNLCKDIKEEIEINGVRNRLGVWSGLGIKVFALNEFSQRFGELKQFNRSVLELVSTELNDTCRRYLEEGLTIKIKQYDICFGVSGVFNLLLDNMSSEMLKRMDYTLKYLIWVASYSEENGVPHFLISGSNQLNAEDKEKFPNGAINLGMAHGMIGVLVVLSKARWKGLEADGLTESIRQLFTFYENFCTEIDGIPYWPPQLSYEDWKEGKKVEKNNVERASWCYGNVGIIKGLQKAAIYSRDQQRAKVFEKKIKAIINQPIEKYNLNMPVLCHGYANILMLMVTGYRKCNDKEYLKNLNPIINKILIDSMTKEHKINFEIFEGQQSILQGMIGVALALSSVLTMDSHYEKVFLMD